MIDGQFSDLETYVVVERYKQDSSIAYELSDEDLDRLLNVMGELEPIIDAINVRNNASIEQRARDIGCSPEDFDTHESDGDIVMVSDLEYAASIPWDPCI